MSDADDRRAQDRRRRAILRFPERRSGFDRRFRKEGVAGAAERALEYVRDHDFVLAAMLAVVNVLNVSDLIITLQLMRYGALEGNPVMDSLIGSDPLLAGVFKALLIGAVSLVIWRMRRYRSILALAMIALAGFATLLLYEAMLLVRIS